jgi:hypothetical protein
VDDVGLHPLISTVWLRVGGSLPDLKHRWTVEDIVQALAALKYQRALNERG